jgi:hypothetical protein
MSTVEERLASFDARTDAMTDLRTLLACPVPEARSFHAGERVRRRFPTQASSGL